MARKMWIDTDTASDDAVAIIMALRSRQFDVVGISTVAGNVSAEQAARNALYTAELCDSDVPVYEGAERPLTREPVRAHFFHGSDGMGGCGFDTTRTAEPTRAVEALLSAVHDHPGLTLVTLGPLTNIALALGENPQIAERIETCVVMGGAANTVGNITPAAEFNIWCDPEAAQVVFASCMTIEMVGWELCRGRANLDDDDISYLRHTIDTPRAHFTVDCNRIALKTNRAWLGEPGIALPDPVAMAIALEPSICTRKSRHYVQVECAGELTRGMTVVDELDTVGRASGDSAGGRRAGETEGGRGVGGGHAGNSESVACWRPLVAKGEPWVTVCREIDCAAWKRLLFDLLK